MLARGLTSGDVLAYLREDKLAPLADLGMLEGVDGDLLIGAIELSNTLSPDVLKGYFGDGAPPGLLGLLAQRVKAFLNMEKALASQRGKRERYAVDDEKREKLRAAIELEKAAAIGTAAAGLAFGAAVASGTAAKLSKADMKRIKFEKDGADFIMKVPTVETTATPHFTYYLTNMDEMLKLLAVEGEGEGPATVISSERGSDNSAKKKKGSAIKSVLKQRIHVSGPYLAKVFREREESNVSLRL
jgi:hypothetical protein